MSMNEIKVNRKELLERVTKNRETHRETFLKAQEVFRKDVIEKLDMMLSDARKGLRYTLHVGFPEPQDMTKEYDMVIEMLTMSVDEEILITQSEFKCYVLDQWSWKSGWETTTSNYLNK